MIVLLIRCHQHILVAIRSKLFQLFLVTINHIVNFLGITASNSRGYVVITQEFANLLILVSNLVLSLLNLLTQLLILTDSIRYTERNATYDKTRKSADSSPDVCAKSFHPCAYDSEGSHG